MILGTIRLKDAWAARKEDRLGYFFCYYRVLMLLEAGPFIRAIARIDAHVASSDQIQLRSADDTIIGRVRIIMDQPGPGSFMLSRG